MRRVKGNKRGTDDDDIDDKGGARHDQRRRGALPDADDIQCGQDADARTREEHNVVVEKRENAADVLKA